MKVALFTLGCKVNQYETQSLREELIRRGFEIALENQTAFDVAVVNSCTVTAESDRKTRQLVHRLRRNNPTGIIVLTGCMVQASPRTNGDFAGADIVVGNTDIKKIADLIEKFIAERKQITEICPHTENERFNTPNITDFAERTRAYMKIEDGCNRYCSYCIIPFARGFVRSKPLNEIKKEAEDLASRGFIEIVLVGINLSAYGKDECFNLCDAVDTVSKVEGIKRVRLGSLEPDHISDEMLKRFKENEKFCPQFHLSLQSGCDETLKRMNRHYDTAFYADLIKRIRKMFDNAAITTDIMVGFAGETEEEFNKSVAFLKEIGFSKAHVFAYSRRGGTVAYGMKGQVTNAEKSRRSKLMSSAAAECEKNFLASHIGKTLPVLFETSDGKKCEGYTDNYLRVLVETEKNLKNQTANVKIIKAYDEYCVGEISVPY